MKETHRGMINHDVTVVAATLGLTSYFSRFNSFHFLCVFFNFHTDEDCGTSMGQSPIDASADVVAPRTTGSGEPHPSASTTATGAVWCGRRCRGRSGWLP